MIAVWPGKIIWLKNGRSSALPAVKRFLMGWIG